MSPAPSSLAKRPIFVIGAPRSGTTILYEALATHPRLGWLSNYASRFPALGSLTALLSRVHDLPLLRKVARGEKTQRGQGEGALNRFRPMPVEDYEVWRRLCGPEFARGYLLGAKATAEQRRRTHRTITRLLSFQGRERFLAKLTGPPRIGFLDSLFPDAVFVHVVRDGRAVVGSLLKVGFWREGGGLERPWWHGGLAAGWESEWEAHGRTPMALAAIQWRRLMEVTADEAATLAPGRWHELRYEDFVAGPPAALRGVLSSCDLEPAPETEAWLGAPGKYRNLNDRNLAGFSADEMRRLEEILGSGLNAFGYD